MRHQSLLASVDKNMAETSNAWCTGRLRPSLLFSPSELFKLWSLHVQLTAFLIKQIKKIIRQSFIRLHEGVLLFFFNEV